MVECDVQLTRDREVVVFHDADLKRLGGSADLLKSLTAADMKSRVGAPTLFELLTDPGCPAKVNIELKTDEARGESGLEREVIKVVRAAKAEHRVLFSSFNPLSLARMAKLAPGIPRGLLVTDEKDAKNKIYLRRMWLGLFAKPHIVHVDQSMITPLSLERWSDRHLKVAAWTVNDQRRAAQLSSEGVVSLITDTLYAKPHAP